MHLNTPTRVLAFGYIQLILVSHFSETLGKWAHNHNYTSRSYFLMKAVLPEYIDWVYLRQDDWYSQAIYSFFALTVVINAPRISNNKRLTSNEAKSKED